MPEGLARWLGREKVVALGFEGERVVFAGLFGLFEGVGVELLRCDVAGLRRGIRRAVRAR